MSTPPQGRRLAQPHEQGELCLWALQGQSEAPVKLQQVTDLQTPPKTTPEASQAGGLAALIL